MILWALLALSLAVNVFFAGGVAYRQLLAEDHRRTAGSVDELAAELGLSGSSEEALEAFVQRFRERRASFKASGDDIRADFIEIMQAETFDRSGVERLLERRTAERVTFFTDFAEGLHGFLWQLPPDKREAFLDRVRDRGFIRSLLKGGDGKS